MVKSNRMPERLRLIKLLRTHGLRHAERLREDEMRRAIHELGLLLDDEQPNHPINGDAPSSTSGIRVSEDVPATRFVPVMPSEDELQRFDDPYALPMFREPKVQIPEGARTFLRLVAVDWSHVYATWDLAADVWSRLTGQVELRIVPAGIEDVLAGDEALLRQRVYAHSRSWYLPVSGVERSALQAVLLHLDRDQVEVLATSNVTIVPPHQLSSPGPLWFATLAPTAERKPLVEEALVRALAGQPVTLPTGTAVAQTGQVIESTEQPYATNGSESFPRRTLVAGAERGGLPLPPALGAWSGTVRFGGAFVATSHRPESEQGGAS